LVKKTPEADDQNAEKDGDDALILSPDVAVSAQSGEPEEEIEQEVSAEVAKPARKPGLSILLGIVLGGVIAAGIGFYAARYVVPEGWPFPGVAPEPDPIALEQVEQADRLAALEAQMALQAQAIATLEVDETAGDLAAKLERAQSQLAQTIATLNAVDARLSEVEKIPQGSGTQAAEAAAAAYERELVAMRDMLAGELARIEAAGQAAQSSGLDAEAMAEQAQVSAALAQIRAALDNGQPFEVALQGLSVEVPDTLSQAATQGVPTLVALQSAFPNAARNALDASLKAQIEDGSVGRIAGFLRRQLGTRSLEPREGDDPDAILSRAEGALEQGQLNAALAELSALPSVGQAQMSTWVAQVQTRLDVLEAADTLTTTLNQE